MTKTYRSRRGLASRLVTVAAISAMIFAVMPLSAASAAHLTGVTDLPEPADNVESALLWSQIGSHPDGALASGARDPLRALLGRDDIFPDNLASGALQGNADGPLLLTASESLDDRVVDELERLDVDEVVILGLENAISTDVQDELEQLGYETTREGGVTRIETAIEVTERSGATTALLARADGPPNGDNSAAFADSLAGGGWAAEDDHGVLLTQSETLTDSVADYLESNGITQVFVLGDTGAVSQETMDAVEDLGIDVERVGGSNRAATAVRVAEERGFADASEADGVIIVEGYIPDAWADGFPAAATSALEGGDGGYPILLSNGDDLPPETEAFLVANADIDIVCGTYASPVACAAAADSVGSVDINLDSTTLAPGDDVTGTATGDVASLTVSGCGLADDTVVTVEDDGTFTIPGFPGDSDLDADGDETGTCVLTFTATTEDGEEVVRTFTITIDEPAQPPGPITLDQTSAPAGGTITGTVDDPGSVATITVTGCGFQNQTVNFGVDGSFSLTIPAGQAPGNCTLTFNIQNSDGTQETQVFNFTVTQGTRPTTAGPDLISATANTGANTVSYLFDTPVAFAGATGQFFHVYDAAGNRYTSTFAQTSTDGATVIAQFDGGDISVANAVRATVNAGAVADAAGRLNYSADAALQSPTQVAGRTAAPDLVSVDNIRVQAGLLEADFTFDEAVDPANIDETGFKLIDSDANPNPGITGTAVVSGGGAVVEVTFNFAVVIPISELRRGSVDPLSVQDPAGNANVLHAEPIGGNKITVAPDLISAAVTGPDQITYTFDQPVGPAPNAPAFRAYSADGRNGPADPSTLAAGAGEPNAMAAVRSNANLNQVIATFNPGTVAVSVGASVIPGAVQSTSGPGSPAPNERDEVPLQAIAFTAGRTAIPDLVSVTITFNEFGDNTVRFAFDQAVPATLGAPGDFQLVDADGIITFNMVACTPAGANVTCTGPAAFSNAFARAAVVGAVDANGPAPLGNTDPAGTLDSTEGATAVSRP